MEFVIKTFVQSLSQQTFMQFRNGKTSSDYRTQQKWVKFTDETQVHEIPAASPPKPKRTRKAHPVEKRSVTVDLANLGTTPNGSEPDGAKVETVDQGQRASMTSLEDLKKFDATKGTYHVPPKEKANLTQVKNSISRSTIVLLCYT